MKTLISLSLLVGLSVIAGAASNAWAAQFFAEEGNVRLTSPIEDDVYALGENIELRGSIAQDAFVAARSILVTAPIGGDFFGAAQTIQVNSQVQDDAFAAGEEIGIRNEIQGDAFLAGRTIVLEKESAVTGNVYAAAEELTVRGTIDGDLKVAGKAFIGREAIIGGSLISYGAENQEPVVEAGAKIGGGQRHYAMAVGQDNASTLLLHWVRSVMALFIAGLILLYGFPKLLRIIQATLETGVVSSLITGVLWSLLWIPIVIVLCMVGIGWRVGIGVAGITVAGYVVATAGFAILAGEWLMRVLQQRRGTSSATLPSSSVRVLSFHWAHALLGAVVIQSIQLIGGVGWMITSVGTVLVLGALVIGTWRSLRRV